MTAGPFASERAGKDEKGHESNWGGRIRDGAEVEPESLSPGVNAYQ